MHRLLTIGVRRPRAALAAWLIATAMLGIYGLGVGQHLTAPTLTVPGTESAREFQLFRQHFSPSVDVPILLQGPRAALNREGPALAAGLAKLPGARVISAWAPNSLGPMLRRSSTSALVLVSVALPPHVSEHGVTRSINRTIYADIARPVVARVSGIDAIGTQLQSASLSAVSRAELIAIPVLLIVLLIVFGSVTAAAIPALLGLGTVFAGFGVLSLLAQVAPLTDLTTSAASMMGLALGVDYSLLVVSRFRDELPAHPTSDELRRAATVAALRAGRTVAFAGGAIALLMVSALLVSTGTLLISAVTGVIVVALVSVMATIVAAPAALTLLGGRVAHRAMQRSARLPRATPAPAGGGRPLWRSPLFAAIVAVGLLAVAWRATSLATGPPDARQLPTGSTARHDYEQLSRAVGAGWATPFELTAVVPDGVITTLPRLDALASAQREIGRDHDVAAVIGPGTLATSARPLLHAEASLSAANASLQQSARDVGGLTSNLGQAAVGAQRVQSGFSQAAAAVGTLASGGNGGASAVARLRAGLQQATDGSRLANQALAGAQQAAARIASGGDVAAAGAAKLAAKLGAGSSTAASAEPQLISLAQSLRDNATNASALASPLGSVDSNVATASGQLDRILSSLGSVRFSRRDQTYRTVLGEIMSARSTLAATPSTVGVVDKLRQLSATDLRASTDASLLASGVATLGQTAGQLQNAAAALSAGISQLNRGEHALANGIERLASSGAALTTGMATLSGGTGTLGAKLATLQSGAQQLASGLTQEESQTGNLAGALSAGQRRAAADQHALPGNSKLLKQLIGAPGVFSSGHAVLAALQGASATQRAGLDYTIDAGSDGQAARLLIVPRSAPGSAATAALRQRLQKVARSLSQAIGAQAAVGGPSALLRDYANAASGRMPLLIVTLMLVTFVLLALVFRSLLAPLISVLLNLVTVGAAFGALALLAGGAHPILGGPGYVDALSVSAMFTAIFALSIDYQVFLLMRMREGWLRTGNVSDGVDYGVARTKRVVAGAAAIMAGVFLAFSTADVATIRQLGVGLALAVVIDATVVRLVLLPAALRLGGRFTWWMPRWLDDRLPALDIGAERRPRSRTGDDELPLADLDAQAPTGALAGIGTSSNSLGLRSPAPASYSRI
jgi:RND superfamily putative drug exporter